MLKHEIVFEGVNPSKRIAFIMGWGNTLTDPWLNWFKAKAIEQNWTLLIIEIPCEYSNFKLVLEDMVTILTEFKCEVLLCHSMGSLFGRFIDLAAIQKRLFLSPFWKVPQRTLILGSYSLSRVILNMLRWCKIPILYRNFEDEDIGDIDLPKNVPRYISPSTMYTVMQAQNSLPPQKDNDVVIYCLTDKLIDTSVCRGITYSGGHFAFSVYERNEVFQKIAGLLTTDLLNCIIDK